MIPTCQDGSNFKGPSSINFLFSVDEIIRQTIKLFLTRSYNIRHFHKLPNLTIEVNSFNDFNKMMHSAPSRPWSEVIWEPAMFSGHGSRVHVPSRDRGI